MGWLPALEAWFELATGTFSTTLAVPFRSLRKVLGDPDEGGACTVYSPELILTGGANVGRVELP